MKTRKTTHVVHLSSGAAGIFGLLYSSSACAMAVGRKTDELASVAIFKTESASNFRLGIWDSSCLCIARPSAERTKLSRKKSANFIEFIIERWLDWGNDAIVSYVFCRPDIER